MAKTPAYQKLYTEIKNLIREGVYAPGTYLPTESELEKTFQTSRTTVRKAVKLLASEGFVNVMQGRGTEVQDVAAIQRLNKITSFTETLTKKGYTVTSQGMCIQLIQASSHVQHMMKLNEDEQVFRVQRVQCANGKPVGILENYLKADLFPELDKLSGTFVSLYNMLEKNYGLKITEASERISAASADFIESQILQIPVGAPLLVSRRITLSEGVIFDYSINKSIADKFEYSIYMVGRDA